MGWLKTLVGWASSAWNGLTGAALDPVAALTSLWHYITSLHDALAWLLANPVVRFFKAVLQWATVYGAALTAIRDLMARFAAWIWAHQVLPVKVELTNRIIALTAWAVLQFYYTDQLIEQRYRQALAYARQLTDAERAERVAAVKAEHAAMLAGDRATLATVNRLAAAAYNGQLHDRLGVVGGILQDLAGHTPAIKQLLTLALKYLVDVENIDDPVIRWLANKAIAEIVNNAEVDKIAGKYAGDLLGVITGQVRAVTLADVIRDICDRLATMEKQWAQFYADGGAEVEQAGKEWKDVTGVLVNAGITGMTALAIADPAAWAKGISDTIGTAGDDAMTGIVRLIGG